MSVRETWSNAPHRTPPGAVRPITFGNAAGAHHRRCLAGGGALGQMRATTNTLILLCTAALLLSSSGCMTSAVIHDAKYPKPTDAAPWANYLLLPITVPADIATSPIQVPAYISFTRGHRRGCLE
jgi:hypothetical protein